MKKKYGQNFLINQSIVKHIVNISNLNSNDEVLEVGPGDGILTKEILNKKPKKLIAVEIDNSLNEKLKKLFNERKKSEFELIFADALKFRENTKFKKNFIIISNLPYNISLPLLIKWIRQLNNAPFAKKMILMFQKEVAERIIANINSKKYGRISVLTSSFYNIKKIIDVDNNNFFPVPKVNSTILEFNILKKAKININDIKYLEKITKDFFNTRRKKIKKKIQSIFSKEIINENSLEKFYDLRPENLSTEIYCKLALLLKKN